MTPLLPPQLLPRSRRLVPGSAKALAKVAGILLGGVLLAHWPQITGWLSSNPMPWAAHLSEALPHTVLPGLPGWNDPNTGLTTQALGGLAARDWLRGIVPWWNPYSGVGLPLAAEMQNSALFLPFVLLLRFAGGLLLLKLSLQIVACFATYALLRQIGTRVAVAALGALCFGLNGTFAWMGHGPIMPVAFLPLMLLGVERSAAAAKQRRSRGWLWISVGLAYAVVSGFPETAYLDGLLVALWAGLRLCRAEPATRWAFVRKVLVGGSIGLLVAMPAILPFLEALPESSIGYHAASNAFVLPRRELALFLTPYAYGPISYAGQWFEAGAMGGFLQLGLLPVALLGLVAGKQERPLRWLIAIWSAAMFAQTQAIPLIGNAMNLLPLFRITVVYRYVWPTWELGLVVIACLALEDWLSGRITSRISVVLATLACAGTVAVGLRYGYEHIRVLYRLAPDYWMYLGGSIVWAIIVLLSGAALLVRRPTRWRGAALGALLATEAIGLFSFTLLSGTSGAFSDWPAIRFLQQRIGFSRFYTLGPISPNYGALFSLASINLDYLPVLKVWPDYVREHLYPRSGIVFGPDGLPPKPGQEDQTTALRDRVAAYEAVGTKFVVAYHGTEPFKDFKGISGPVFSGTAIDVYELPSPAPYFEIVRGSCILTAHRRTVVDAKCDSPAILLRRELITDGWSATVNGREQSIRRLDGLFQAVRLPSGRSVVDFIYAPPHIYWAYLAMAFGLAGLSLTLLPETWRSPRQFLAGLAKKPRSGRSIDRR